MARLVERTPAREVVTAEVVEVVEDPLGPYLVVRPDPVWISEPRSELVDAHGSEGCAGVPS